MSRTDKTKPWRVRVAEHNPTAVHNHENGVCDLPPSPLVGRLGVWTSRHCSWSDWNIARDSACCRGCNCRVHSRVRKYYRRQEKARRRREWKAEVRRLLAD